MKVEDKLKKELARIEKELEKVRGGSPLIDGWQTQRLAKKARKWDYYAQERMKILAELECCNSKDGDEMCFNCNCWKHTRAMCS